MKLIRFGEPGREKLGVLKNSPVEKPRSMSHPSVVPGLTLQGCCQRQDRLRRVLQEQGLDAALICDPRHVHYFTGYWQRSLYSPLVFIDLTSGATLVAPVPPNEAVAVNEVIIYESNRMGTLVDHQRTAALRALEARIGKHPRLGSDIALRRYPGARDLSNEMLSLRRAKDEDEVSLLRCAFRAAEAAYRYAIDTLRPGVTEVDLFAGMQAAAVRYVGEGIGEFGNDFQIGALGSAPRFRAAEAGEVAILDVTVVVRGYASDMCRSFVVGGQPTDEQIEAHQRVLEVINLIERRAAPGVSCADLHRTASNMLDGHRGLGFRHHLGHGVGLCPHEAPRLNIEWDDTLEIGDVFTLEPGLYGKPLRAGLRVEQAYHLTGSGLVLLTESSTAFS